MNQKYFDMALLLFMGLNIKVELVKFAKYCNISRQDAFKQIAFYKKLYYQDFERNIVHQGRIDFIREIADGIEKNNVKVKEKTVVDEAILLLVNPNIQKGTFDLSEFCGITSEEAFEYIKKYKEKDSKLFENLNDEASSKLYIEEKKNIISDIIKLKQRKGINVESTGPKL